MGSRWCCWKQHTDIIYWFKCIVYIHTCAYIYVLHCIHMTFDKRQRHSVTTIFTCMFYSGKRPCSPVNWSSTVPTFHWKALSPCLGKMPGMISWEFVWQAIWLSKQPSWEKKASKRGHYSCHWLDRFDVVLMEIVSSFVFFDWFCFFKDH